MLKKLFIYFFIIIEIVFAKQNVNIGNLQKTEDLYWYLEKERKDIRGVYSDLLNDFNEKGKFQYSFNKSNNSKPEIMLRVSNNFQDESYNYIVTPFYYKTTLFSLDENLKIANNIKIGFLISQDGINKFITKYKNQKIIKKEYFSERKLFKALETKEVDAIALENRDTVLVGEKKLKIIDNIEYREKMGISTEKKELYIRLKKYFEELEVEEIQKLISENRISFFKKLLEEKYNIEGLKNRYTDLKINLLNEKEYSNIYYIENSLYKGSLSNFFLELGKILEIPINIVENFENANIEVVHLGQPEKKYFYTRAYYKTQLSIITLKNKGVYNLKELENSKIGVLKEDKDIIFLRKDISNLIFKEIETVEKGVKKLLNKEIDYLIVHYTPLKQEIASNKNLLKKLKIAKTIDSPTGIGLRIKKEDEELYDFVSLINNSYGINEFLLKNDNQIEITEKLDKTFLIKLILPILLFAVVLLYSLKKLKKRKNRAELLASRFLESLLSINDISKSESGLHTKRMALYCNCFAEYISFPLDELKLGATIHDIGKVAISKEILNKKR